MEIVESQKVIAETRAKNRELQQKLTLQEYRNAKKIQELDMELQAKKADLEKSRTKYEVEKKSKKGLARREAEKGVQHILDKYGAHASAPYNFFVKVDETFDLASRLKDEKSHLEKQKDESDARYRELETRFNQLQLELNSLKNSSSQEIVELKSTLRFRSFELERLHLLLTEADEKVKQHAKENLELKRKVDNFKNQMRDMRSKNELERTRLEMKLQAKSSRLGLYDKMEDSLDKLVVQAAHASGDAVNIPTDPARRIQQSVDFCKRALELEQVVKEQKEEILNLYDQRQAMRAELGTFKATTSEPVSNLIRTISEKNAEVDKANKRITAMEKEYHAMKADKEVMERSLDNAKACQKEMFEIFKARSSILAVNSTSEMPKNFPYHELEPGEASLASMECLIPEGPPLSSHSSSFVLSDHKWRIPRGNTPVSTKPSSSGSYLSFQKSRSGVKMQSSSEDAYPTYFNYKPRGRSDGKIESSGSEQDTAGTFAKPKPKHRSSVRFQSVQDTSLSHSRHVALRRSIVKPNKSNLF